MEKIKNILSNEIQTVKVEIPDQKSFFYPIIVGENLLQQAGALIKKHSKAEKLLVVTNDKVFRLFGEKIKTSLTEENLEIEFVLLEDGEKYKNINSLEIIWRKAIEFKLERKDAIVALGGGVIGDVTGFAAATYLRGIDFIQIPTTLLSQVDSSVGGKVAVNHKLGKNLIGNFYQPKLVITDTSTLKTLPVEELKVGLAEVLKYAMIEKSCGLRAEAAGVALPTRNAVYGEQSSSGLRSLNTSFIEYLKHNKDAIFALDKDIIQELVKYCCELKANVVNIDEKESGLRAILNFGHTIGHAVERCLNYENITHGQAITIGMKGVLHISKAKNLIRENYYNNCIELFNLYEMNCKSPQSIQPKAIYEAMFNDKKILSGKIRFVLSTGESKVGMFNDVDKKTVLEAIETLY